MHRKLVALALLLLAGCERPAPPHVFVFLVDTLRADHLGCYGYARPTSPELDAFAQDAFVFTDTYSPSPWTLPAVTSIFTGLPPQLHGVRGRSGYLPPHAETWAETLAASGYRTSAWFTNGHLQPRYGLEQGFADYDFVSFKTQSYATAPQLMERWHRALDALPVDQPLMQYLHFMEPHAPYLADREYRRYFLSRTEPALEWYTRTDPPVERVRFLMNSYDAEIRQVDAAFGEFIRTLQERGWYENAWIIFVGDHGEEFYEHNHLGHGNGLWENLLRVPLVVRPPGGRAGAEAKRLAALVDQPVPTCAIADVVAGPGSVGLGASNLERFGVHAPLEFIPTPDAPAPALRRASFSLDGVAGMSVGEGDVKLTWYENPAPHWFASNLATDPDEWKDSGERPAHLVAELEAWAALGWRGLRVTNTTDDTLSVKLRTEPREALFEARVPVGEIPPAFRMPRKPVNREVEWTAAPGQWLVLRTDAGSQLLQERAGEWVEFEDPRWGIEQVGPPENPTDDRPPMDPDLEEKLRALGYLK